MRNNTKYFHHLRFAALIFSFYWFGCSEAPTDIGSEALENQGVTVLETTVVQDNSLTRYSADTSYKDILPLGSSRYLLIGNYKQLEANIAIRFYPFFFGKESAILKDSIQILSAKVIVNSPYVLGDSSASFGITAHKIQANWSASALRSDTTDFLNPSAVNISSSFRRDSSSYYSFSLDTALVRQWLKSSIDTSQPKNYGILIKPAAGTAKIAGWEALSGTSTFYPLLEYKCRIVGGGDTTLTVYAAEDAHVVRGSLPAMHGDDFYVQSGLIGRTNLWFDLSVIPKNSVINKATLILKKHSDASRSYAGNAFTDAVAAYPIQDSAANTLTPGYGTLLKLTDSVYAGNVTEMLALFYAKGKNANFQLTTADYLNGAELFAFFGSKAASLSNRPKLSIIYSRRAN